jgi:hypothetical protein
MSEIPPEGKSWVTIEIDWPDYEYPTFNLNPVIKVETSPKSESNLSKARAHLTRAAKHWHNAETTASLAGDIGTHVNEMRQGARETRDALEALNRHLEEAE